MATSLTAAGLLFPGGYQTSKMDSSLDRGRLIQINTYTTSGANTWTKPAGCNKIRVLMVGGGGGASGHSESGGAGQFGEKFIDVSSLAVGATIAITIGAGGAGVTYASSGGAGGTSSFGSYMTCQGGYGANTPWGSTGNSHSGGLGGHTGTGGDFHQPGGAGQGHRNATGQGGSSFFGGSKYSTHPNNSFAHYDEGSYSAPGTGGPGEHTTYSRGGAAGTAGCCIVYSYI